MKTQLARTDLPKGKPIAVYQKSLGKMLMKLGLAAGAFLVALYTFSNAPSASKNTLYTVIFMGLIIIVIYLIWDAIRSKIEVYSDAMIIYSVFGHTVFKLHDIEDLITSSYESNSLAVNHTTFTLQRRDGVSASFTDAFQSYQELVERLQKVICDDNGPISRTIKRINDGNLFVFSQFTVTTKGVTTENGEFRAWADIEVIEDKFTNKLLIAERNKRTTIGGQSIWVQLPARHSIVFESVLQHYLTKT